MMHLIRNHARDESDVWCDQYLTTGAITDEPSRCDCRPCITKAASELRRYTSEVIKRLQVLRPNHDADDCACHGHFTTTISWKP